MTESVDRCVLQARFFNRMLVLAIGCYVIVLMVVGHFGIPYLLANSSLALALMTGGLALAAAANLVLAPLLFRRALRQAAKSDGTLAALRSAWLTRGGIYEGIAIFGFILGLQGGAWYLVLPFFLVSGTALVVTTPSAREAEQVLHGRSELEDQRVLVAR